MNLKIDTAADFIALHQERIQQQLQQCLNHQDASTRLNEAMCYSILNGGKRLRPLLVYATGLDLVAKIEDLDAAALAVELIHGYSLVHDDLPAMDDDDLRRGKATCHIAFDEATAILSGDALQSLAFEVLSAPSSLEPSIQLSLVQMLAQAIGAQGMAAGQMLDLQSEAKSLELAALQQLHSLKTGVLIQTCLELAGLIAKQSHLLPQLKAIGAALGLAFQIQDDVLDIEGDTHILGKRVGADLALDKSTYPKLLGLEAAKQKFQEEYRRAEELIKMTIPKAHYLPLLIKQLFNRKF